MPDKQFQPVLFHFHIAINHPAAKTGIFYINNTNGPTVFENRKTIDCVENRMVIFPCDYRHAGSSHTTESERIIINFIWF